MLSTRNHTIILHIFTSGHFSADPYDRIAANIILAQSFRYTAHWRRQEIQMLYFLKTFPAFFAESVLYVRNNMPVCWNW